MAKQREKLRQCLTLTEVFMKIGLFTFGGGYAMIPLIKKEVVEQRHWIEEGELIDMIAVSESTPGSIAVNIATFIGYRIAGRLGAFFATLGVVVPSFVIIAVISVFLRQFEQSMLVKYAFWGIRIAVLALIFNALLTVFHNCGKSFMGYVIMALALLLSVFSGISAIYIIVICAVVGFISTKYSIGGMVK